MVRGYYLGEGNSGPGEIDAAKQAGGLAEPAFLMLILPVCMHDPLHIANVKLGAGRKSRAFIGTFHAAHQTDC